jgi:CheY-like chemotaxis protein
VARARAAGRTVELRLPPSLPDNVCGDGARLDQIFLPIVEQTFQMLEAPRIALDLRIAKVTEADLALEFEVSERGSSAALDRSHLKPFAESDVSKYSAAGLGLTVAARWLKYLRGQLWTDADKHARFYGTLTLPRQYSLRVAPASQAASDAGMSQSTGPSRPPSHKHAQTRTPLRVLHVLVADDTPANQKVVKAVLTKRGHRVELADNGRHAVDQLRKQAFDVVLMDAQMPMMNGLQATAAIRHLSDAARSRVPIIALTGHTLQEDRQRCLAAGMNDYLPKPIDIAALIDCVEYHGNATQAGSADARTSAAGTASTDRVASERQTPTDTLAQFQQQPLDDANLTIAEPDQDFLAGALARLGGDEALLRELIRLFQQDAEVLLHRIREEIASGDAESAMRAAHNLRGLAANFDDSRTISAAGAVEQAAKREDLEEALRLLPEVESSLTALQTALQRY